MNRGGFSLKTFVGIRQALKAVALLIGIPLTVNGRQRKLGALIQKLIKKLNGRA